LAGAVRGAFLDARARSADTVESMLRALALTAVALASMGVDAGLDGGARTDASLADGGVVDAGARTPAVTSSWVHADGGFFTDAGVSDVVVVAVGGSQAVQFPHPIIFGHCDDQSLLVIDGTEDALVFRGVAPGTTYCGFWYRRQSYPNRYVEVTVVGPAAAPDAGPHLFWQR